MRSKHLASLEKSKHKKFMRGQLGQFEKKKKDP